LTRYRISSLYVQEWLEKQKVWFLPIPYFHVVFTIDHVFNALVWRNQEEMYNLLIRTAAETLKQYGQRYLGGELGFTMVLHTWGQKLQRHLHGHCIVTGGALVSTKDGYRWQAAKHKFLFPAELFSKDFRQAFCRGVRRLWQQGKLDTADESLDVAAMLTEAQGKKWDLYIQPPPCGTENLKEYLGRYVYGIAISNHRILEFQDGQVTFEYYDNLDQGKLKTMTVSAVEFIGLFLMHVLPSNFTRIRHFGLHHGSCRAKLQQARKLLGLPIELPVILKLKLIDWLMMILKTEEDPRLCPDCHQGLMLSVREFGPISKWRLQMLTFLGLFSRWMFAPAP